MRHFQSATMTDMYQDLTDALIHGDEDSLDLISSVDVQIHDVVAEADSMVWDFNLKDAWLTKSRWSMMVKQYLDPQELENFIGLSTSRIGLKDRGVAVLRTKAVKPRGGAATGHSNKQTRTWGSCMLNIGYKAVPVPQITLWSRTSYLGYIGALDIGVAYKVGEYLARELGTDVSKFRFVWYNQAIQWHNFKSLAFMLNHVDPVKRETYRRILISPSSELTREEKKMAVKAPAILLSRKWLQKVIREDATGRTYGDFSYNTFRRIVRRFHTEVYGLEYAQGFEGWSHHKKGPKQGEQKEYFKAYAPLPDVDIHALDFGNIGMPANRRYGDPFIGGGEDEADDDD